MVYCEPCRSEYSLPRGKDSVKVVNDVCCICDEFSLEVHDVPFHVVAGCIRQDVREADASWDKHAECASQYHKWC